jgi:GLPGLI family protein
MVNMKIYRLLFVVVILMTGSGMMAQKKVSELTLVYDASISTGNNQPKLADAFDGATTTVYISGTMSRSEMSSALAAFATIHDARTGTAVVLQEISGQKLLIRMTPDNWKDKNRKYEGITFANTDETKTIAGYKCIKAIATMKDGSTFSVYYTKDLVPENTDYNALFKNLEGLPMEYELTQKDLKIKYTVSKINMNPVPASKFDIPKSGYRELTYEESRKQGVSN